MTVKTFWQLFWGWGAGIIIVSLIAMMGWINPYFIFGAILWPVALVVAWLVGVAIFTVVHERGFGG